MTAVLSAWASTVGATRVSVRSRIVCVCGAKRSTACSIRAWRGAVEGRADGLYARVAR